MEPHCALVLLLRTSLTTKAERETRTPYSYNLIGIIFILEFSWNFERQYVARLTRSYLTETSQAQIGESLQIHHTSIPLFSLWYPDWSDIFLPSALLPRDTPSIYLPPV